MADEQTPPQDDVDPTADDPSAADAPDEPGAPSGDPLSDADDLADAAGGADAVDADVPGAGDGEDDETSAASAAPAADAGAADAGDAFDLPGIDDDEIDADEAVASAAPAREPPPVPGPSAIPSSATGEPPPASPAPPVPASEGVGSEALTPVLGAAAAPIGRFGARVGEVLQVGVESVSGHGAAILVTRAEVADYAALEEEFAEIPHLGLELKFAFSEIDSTGFGVLVPLSDLGRLLAIETSPGALSDREFRTGQLDTVATAVRELLDLMSLALFTDELSGAETTLADLRFDDGGTTLAHVADSGDRSAPVRFDLQLTLDGESAPVRCTVVVPTVLLARLTAVLAPGVAMPDESRDFGDPMQEAPPEPTPLRRSASGSPYVDSYDAPPVDDRSFGLNYDIGNVSPLRSTTTRGRADDVEVHPVRFPTLNESAADDRAQRSLDLIMDVQMRVAVELGRSSMSVEDILALGPGSVVELNKLAGEPVDILVNDHLIARGEVVVVDENFGVRVTEIVSTNRRARAMGR